MSIGQVSLPTDPPVTRALAHEHNLSDHEYERMLEILGRAPTYPELGIFSAMWSEHCAYKHSKPVLKRFPTTGPRVLQGPGENAGVMALPNGWAVAFKIESHNHPSAVEPYQGAATGVGGILRDVFTMGARPVAVLNSIRVGPLDQPHNRYLLAGIVRGIGDYGNCVGIPTVAGEVDFGSAYSGNPLVNAMCVGIMRAEELTRAAATGTGNLLIYMGARTGRDGIHGASFASEELTAKSEARRPQVQVADPFTEKLLMEATLELIRRRYVVAIQDMGAAGLTSSSVEMAARGGAGVEIDAALVPTREPEMTPYEILLSESQERMLVVAEPAYEDRVREVAEKWGLSAVTIGRVTDDSLYRILWAGDVVAEISAAKMIDEAPIYTPAAAEDPTVVLLRQTAPPPPPSRTDLGAALEQVLGTPAVASKRWVYEQYDSTVKGQTVAGPGAEAGVICISDESFGVAVTLDGNARFVALDPYEGGKALVAEAARSLACVGAEPMGITNCLNFGNPEKPEIYFQFREACRGIAEACAHFKTPVTGGNVSFYNESPKGAVDPTPVIGMVGLLADASMYVPTHFQREGESVLLFGEPGSGYLGGSVAADVVLDFKGGAVPPVDLEREYRLQRLLVDLARERLLQSARDCSQGGLAVAVAESAMGDAYDHQGFGARMEYQSADVDAFSALFGEDHGRVVVSVRPESRDSVLALAQEHGVPARELGVVTGPDSSFRITCNGTVIERPIEQLRRLYFGELPRQMAQVGE